MHLHKAVTVILLAVFTAGSIFAQPHAGAVFSPYRSGLSIGKSVSGDVFWDFTVGVDYSDPVLKQSRMPGVSGTFSYDFIFWQRDHGFGRSSIYAGPGVSAGYVRDRGKSYGLMVGISGILGYEYDFPGPLSLGVRVVPTFGLHSSSSGEGTVMDIYRNGLLWSFAPHLSLSYSLDPARASSRAGDLDYGRRQGRAPGKAGRAGLGYNGDSRDRVGSGREDRGGVGNGRSGVERGREEERRTQPRFTYGAEWSYSANINHAYRHNYTSAMGRMDIHSNYMCFRSNGCILGHVGINCTENLNFSLYAGYEGIYKGQTVIPVSIRGTWLFGRDPDLSRWLAFLDGGWAVPTSDYNAGPIAKAGGGYRISLSRSVKLDLTLSYQFAYSGIEIYEDDGVLVPVDRIRRNDNYFSSINISFGITL